MEIIPEYKLVVKSLTKKDSSNDEILDFINCLKNYNNTIVKEIIENGDEKSFILILYLAFYESNKNCKFYFDSQNNNYYFSTNNYLYNNNGRFKIYKSSYLSQISLDELIDCQSTID